jgi:hypothetical protein
MSPDQDPSEPCSPSLVTTLHREIEENKEETGHHGEEETWKKGEEEPREQPGKKK